MLFLRFGQPSASGAPTYEYFLRVTDEPVSGYVPVSEQMCHSELENMEYRRIMSDTCYKVAKDAKFVGNEHKEASVKMKIWKIDPIAGEQLVVRSQMVRITNNGGSGDSFRLEHTSSNIDINSGGIVEFDSWTYGVNESFGRLSNYANQIDLDGGTLRYIGTSDTASDRGFNVTRNGGTVENATSGTTWRIQSDDFSDK